MTKPETSLRHILIEHFSREDLKDIIFDLSYDYDEFPESGQKSVLVRELIARAAQDERLPELVDIARDMYADADWPDVTKPQSIDRLMGLPAMPQLPFEPEVIEIPAGQFVMGAEAGTTGRDHERPAHLVTLGFYYIGRYPVTNAQYMEFVRQTGYSAPKRTGWLGNKVSSRKKDHPVSNISWYDAVAYCQWLSEQTGRTYRLPSEAEWEKAARGADGRAYPWGNTWTDGLCNHGSKNTTPVTEFAAGLSPYGCFDMIGNVWEWTITLWGELWDDPQFRYPYKADDGRENQLAGDEVQRVFRGGSSASARDLVRCTSRDHYAPETRDPRIGFRVVRETL